AAVNEAIAKYRSNTSSAPTAATTATTTTATARKSSVVVGGREMSRALTRSQLDALFNDTIFPWIDTMKAAGVTATQQTAVFLAKLCVDDVRSSYALEVAVRYIESHSPPFDMQTVEMYTLRIRSIARAHSVRAAEHRSEGSKKSVK